MVAYLESLFLGNNLNANRRTGAMIFEASASTKTTEISAEIEFFSLRHPYAMKVAHWADLVAAMDSSCAQLACHRTASPALTCLYSWKLTIKMTQNDEVCIVAGAPNERQGCT